MSEPGTDPNLLRHSLLVTEVFVVFVFVVGQMWKSFGVVAPRFQTLERSTIAHHGAPFALQDEDFPPGIKPENKRYISKRGFFRKLRPSPARDPNKSSVRTAKKK